LLDCTIPLQDYVSVLFIYLLANDQGKGGAKPSDTSGGQAKYNVYV